MGKTYEGSGVSIAKADAIVERLRAAVESTGATGFGAFAAVYPLDERRLLAASTDSIGTKPMVARPRGKLRNCGADMAAHTINDVLTSGADPLFLLDYVASARVDLEEVAELVEGAAEVCRAAGCALIGGETAEMPGIYQAGDYDLAGFAVGAVARDKLLPRKDIAPGDAVIGLASSGVHANGFSLVRRIVAAAGLPWDAPAPFEPSRQLGEALLTPTRLYVQSCLAAIRATGAVKALAHITGGGFVDNIPRVLPQGLAVALDLDRVPVHPVFKWLAAAGGVSEREMLRTFNCGIGMIAVLDAEAAEQACEAFAANGETVVQLGEVIAAAGEPTAAFRGRLDLSW